MHQLALKTEETGRTWVPWIVVNGQHSTDIQNRAEKNLLKLICDFYTGVKPSECRGQLLEEPAGDLLEIQVDNVPQIDIIL